MRITLVFVWDAGDGLLVLGYPKESYTKLTGNFFSLRALRALPLYAAGILAVDLLLLFLGYYLSKRNIIRNTEPIIASIETLSDGKPVSLSLRGELCEVAESVNKASRILGRQNEARTNWISGGFPRYTNTAFHYYGVCRTYRAKRCRQRHDPGAGRQYSSGKV